MNGPRFRTVLLVAAKELRESLRDKRTLFVALVLPVLLYPLMMLALAPLVSLQKQRLRDDAQPVAVTGGGADEFVRAVLEPPPGDGVSPPAATGLAVVRSADPACDLRERRIALWVEVPEGFGRALAEERTGSVVVRRDGSDDRSLAAARKLDEAVVAAFGRELDRRSQARGLGPDWRVPIRTTLEDVAPPERRAAFLFGKVLAFVLVVLTLSSSFYPAVDAVAGEKERGTMETLLVAPCARTELVLGKFVAVLAVTLASAVLNLASMGFTLGPLMAQVAPEAGTGLRVTAPVLLGILALLVPIAALFSAVSLALSTLARSVKEGQHYLTPLFLVVMPLSLVVLIPNVPLTPALAPVPVTNAVLFFRDLLLDRAEPWTTAAVLVSTVAWAAAALWASVALFLREETLFRGPEGGTRLVARPRPADAPSAASALFLFAASLALVWYGQATLPPDLVGNVLATQFAVLLAPCAALAWWLRVRPRTTFRLAAPPAAALALAPLLGWAAPVVNAAVQGALGAGEADDPTMRRIAEEMQAFVLGRPWVLSALLFGALPAVCEELVFRGFLLSGLRSGLRGRGGGAVAVVVSAALFALFHIFPEKWPPTFLMGLLLGFLALRTGSIWPGVLVHAVNNATAVLSERPEFGWLHRWGAWERSVPGGAVLACAAVVLAAGVTLLSLRRRRGGELDGPPAPR